MALIVAGLTDVGQKRKNNQDSIGIDSENHIYVVADGMGGHSGGDIASKIAVETITSFARANAKNFAPPELLTKAIQLANEKIRNHGDQNPLLKGMGTTTVALYFTGSTVYIANVGDSRAYMIHKNKFYQLSKDHSLVQEKVNLGIVTREQSAQASNKNVLIRTVGFDKDISVDIFTYKVHRGDLFYICSDGLHGMIKEEDLIAIVNEIVPNALKANLADVQKLVQTLVACANKNGGIDNISLIMALAK